MKQKSLPSNGIVSEKKMLQGKVDSNSNWKTAYPGLILEWHLFLILSLKFVRKILSFVGKHLTQKMYVHFLYFLFKWRGVKPTSISDKTYRKWNS